MNIHPLEADKSGRKDPVSPAVCPFPPPYTKERFTAAFNLKPGLTGNESVRQTVPNCAAVGW
jgi:hypothetical protein